MVEYLYARHAYSAVAAALTATIGRVPFAVAEVVASVLAVSAVVWVVAALLRLVRGSVSGRGIAAGLLKLVAVCGQVVLLFELLWGLNYARRPVAEILGLDMTAPSAEELAQAAEELIAEAAVLRAGLPEGPGGVVSLAGGIEGALHRAPAAFGEAMAPLPVAVPPMVPKAPRASALLSYLGVGGVFVPFTGEPLVNATLPDWEVPYTACHEMAHQRGYAREEDASFVGWRACRGHPDADFRYSATFRGAVFLLAALARADPARYARLRGTLPPPLGRDLAALAAWREKYKSPLDAVQDRVNDAYLKAQGQAEGVASYGRVVDLILAERRAARRPPTDGPAR